MTKKEEIIKRFRKDFEANICDGDSIGEQGGMVNTQYVYHYFESFISSVVDEVREETIKELRAMEKQKWDDAEHCSCLKQAIWKLEGEPEEHDPLPIPNTHPQLYVCGKCGVKGLEYGDVYGHKNGKIYIKNCKADPIK